MSHIHIAPGQHDATVSIYLLRLDFNEPKLILHHHRKIGLYIQFGGHIELHETPWQAAVHELVEETGYDIDQVQILQPQNRLRVVDGATVHSQPIAQVTVRYPGKNHFHTDVVYAFTASVPPRHQPGEGESTNLRLFTRTELASFGNDATAT